MSTPGPCPAWQRLALLTCTIMHAFQSGRRGSSLPISGCCSSWLSTLAIYLWKFEIHFADHLGCTLLPIPREKNLKNPPGTKRVVKSPHELELLIQCLEISSNPKWWSHGISKGFTNQHCDFMGFEEISKDFTNQKLWFHGVSRAKWHPCKTGCFQLLWQNGGRWDDVAIVFPHLIAIVKSRAKLPESVLSWKQKTMGMEIVVTLH